MKIDNLLLLVILLFTSCKTFENNKIITENENNLNVETVIQFWDIANLLIQDEEVPTNKWDLFLNSSANKIYYDVTGNNSNYLKKMALNAFSSSEKQYRDSLLQSEDSFEKLILERFMKTNELKEKLSQHIIWLKENDILKASIRETKQYLPKKIIDDIPIPTMNFIVTGIDAYGYSKGVVIDILLSHDMDLECFGKLAGHEFHHYYIDKIQVDKVIEKRSAKEEAKRLLMTSIQKEGIADLIDKNCILSKRLFPPMVMDFMSQTYNEESGLAKVKKIDSLFTVLNKNKSNEFNMDMVYDFIPAGGHISGYYMGRTIENGGLIEKLLLDVTNPIHFFNTYQEAAKIQKKYQFTKEAIRFINND